MAAKFITKFSKLNEKFEAFINKHKYFSFGAAIFIGTVLSEITVHLLF